MLHSFHPAQIGYFDKESGPARFTGFAEHTQLNILVSTTVRGDRGLATAVVVPRVGVLRPATAPDTFDRHPEVRRTHETDRRYGPRDGAGGRCPDAGLLPV